MKIVLDTNCLMACISRRSPYYWLWKAIQNGELTLCVTTEILEEYEEVIGREWSALAAERTMALFDNLPNLEKIHIHFLWELITEDRDDNKFADCAIASNADYIVTHDRHFNVLKSIDFPKVNCITLQELSEILR